jgi:hypothetical protein
MQISSIVKKKVQCACEPCRKSKIGCDHQRPCSRCRHRGIQDQCVDRSPTKVDQAIAVDECRKDSCEELLLDIQDVNKDLEYYSAESVSGYTRLSLNDPIHTVSDFSLEFSFREIQFGKQESSSFAIHDSEFPFGSEQLQFMEGIPALNASSAIQNILVSEKDLFERFMMDLSSFFLKKDFIIIINNRNEIKSLFTFLNNKISNNLKCFPVKKVTQICA